MPAAHDDAGVPVVSVRIRRPPQPSQPTIDGPEQSNQPAGGPRLATDAGPSGDAQPPRSAAAAAPLLLPQQPCLISGLYSSVSAGVLGYVFGVIPSMLRNRRLGLWRVWAADGWRSAAALAVMSGLYTWVHCICTRIRMRDDGWSRGLAGCATGLALGWKGGPSTALQSCAGLGFISYIFDFGGEAKPAGAATSATDGCRAGLGHHCCGLLSEGREPCGEGEAQGHVPPAPEEAHQASIPSVLWQRWRLGPMNPGASGDSSVLRVPPVMWLGRALHATNHSAFG